jgi:NADH-quinone oxidoreductase subunit J
MFDNLFFFLSAALTLLGAFAVVMTKNLMHSCLYLLASLFGVAGLYATLGADFLAATQLVVYGGGVVILMLFAVMLTGGDDEKESKYALFKVPAMGNVWTFSFACFSAVVIGFVILKIIAGIWRGKELMKDLPNYTSTVEEVGTLLLTDHVLAFEISSILLLGALVGAAVISRPKRNQ